jgi:hypothetical protein
MDKATIAGLIGAMGALVATAPAHAAASAPVDVEQALSAQSYADLLRPIPNASAILKASDESQAEQAQSAPMTAYSGEARIETVQYHDNTHHHHTYHRRHHRRVIRVPVPAPHHHHHHHHHDSTAIIIPRS